MPTPKKPIVFRRIGTPEPEEPPKRVGAPPRKPITPLEATIIKNSGGTLQVLEAPDHPLPGQDLFEFQAQKLAQVEHLMFQGVRSPHLIAQATGMPESTAERYVRAVTARWQTTGAEVDIKTSRGEAMRYMDFLKKELWTQYQTAKASVDAEMKKPASERDERAIGRGRSLMLNLNTQIHTLNGQQIQLQGLTPQAIQQMLVLGGNEDVEVLTRMRKHQGLKEIAAKLGAILAANRQNKVINVTPEH